MSIPQPRRGSVGAARAATMILVGGSNADSQSVMSRGPHTISVHGHSLLRRTALLVVVGMALVAAGCSSSGSGGSDQPSDPATADPAPVTAQPSIVTPAWVVTMAGPSAADEIDGVAGGVGQSVFITGKFENRVTIGATELTSDGAADIPLARIDRSGTVLWARRFGGPGEDNFFDIDADDAGAVATGWFTGTVSFDDVTLTSSGATDCVIAAFTNDGAVRWARALGGPGADGCNEVTVAADGSIVTSLDTEGNWDSPAGPIAPLPGRDTVLLRLNADGDVMWARRVGGNGPQRGKAIAMGPDGSVAFGGDTRGPLRVGDRNLEAGDARTSAWLTYWSPDGDLMWSHTWGGPGNDLVKGVAHNDDAVIAVSTVSGEVSIAGASVDAGPFDSLAIAHFTLDGSLVWATVVTADQAMPGVETIGADDGGVLFAGPWTTGITFGQVDGPSVAIDDPARGSAWLAHYRPNGTIGVVATVAGTTNARPGELTRSGNRLYLDMVLRGDTDEVNGLPWRAQRKDASVWAFDLPG